jgi:hypothetical protein
MAKVRLASKAVHGEWLVPSAEGISVAISDKASLRLAQRILRQRLANLVAPSNTHNEVEPVHP